MNNTKNIGKKYQLPIPALLDRHNEAIKTEDRAYIRELSSHLEKTLANFGIDGYVPRITVGPRVTRFEISLAPGVRVDKVIKHQKDIAVAIKTENIRLQAPIPGKDAVGVEVPNQVSNSVYLRSLLESKAWNNSKAAIPLVLGSKDVDVVDEVVVPVKTDDKDVLTDEGFDYQPYIKMVLDADYDL